VGIRPEEVSLAKPEDEQTIQGRIYLVENLGMHNLISVRVKGLDSITVRALLPSSVRWETEEVTLSLPQPSIYWFDPKTGDRLCNHCCEELC
jgi:multiple sugar transport system ATP-binding protein